MSGGAIGTVVTHCKASDRGFDWHASQPYATLIDASSGGLVANGGNHLNLPNHLQDLTFWNYDQSEGKQEVDYDWWKVRDCPSCTYYNAAKVVKPNFIGFHGSKASSFKRSSLGVFASNGIPVEPASLYAAQLESRLGSMPPWYARAKAAYAVYLSNGYFAPDENTAFLSPAPPNSPAPQPAAPCSVLLDRSDTRDEGGYCHTIGLGTQDDCEAYYWSTHGTTLEVNLCIWDGSRSRCILGHST